MTYRGERDEVFSSSRLGEASKGLLRIAGGWGNVSGPGIFMFRALFSGATAAIFTGMTGATISAFLYDTAALPFIISAAGGFLVGMLGFYRDTLRKAILSLERFDLWRRDDFAGAVFQRHWTMQGMLVAAWLSAQPALDQVQEEREQALIEQERDEDQNEAKR